MDIHYIINWDGDGSKLSVRIIPFLETAAKAVAITVAARVFICLSGDVV